MLDNLLDFTVLLLLDETTAGFVELLSFHGEGRVVSVSLRDDVSFDGDGLGGIDVISSDHSDGDSSSSDGSNSSGNFLSDSVFNSNDADEDVVSGQFNVLNSLNGLSFSILVFLSLSFFVVLLAEFTLLDISVRNSDGTEGVLGVVSDLAFDDGSGSVVNVLNFTISIHVLGALSKDDLGSSLHLSSDSIAISVAGRERSHSLSAGSEVETSQFSDSTSISLFLNEGLLFSEVAASDEVHHGFISGRSALKRDVTADTLGDLFDQLFVESHLNKVLVFRDLDGLLGFGINNEVDSVSTELDADGRLDIDIFSRVKFDDFHHVVGEGAGLIGTDVISSSHDFTRGKLLHITLILQHLDDGVS